MKRLLSSFLILLMLMPSLACAMPVCADEARAAAVKQPCADHSSHHEGETKPAKGKVSLLKDCMGLDLQTADAPVLKKPDMAQDAPFVVIAAAIIPQMHSLRDADSIRGPPPGWPDFHQIYPSILLTTQRLRI